MTDKEKENRKEEKMTRVKNKLQVVANYVIATDKVANIPALQQPDAGDILVEDRQTAAEQSQSRY